MMFAVYSFVESLNFTAALMMVVTELVLVYVSVNEVYSKCLSFFFTCFDGLKLFTYQSDLQLL